MTCTCTYEETGGPESGPSISMTPHESCPLHGREADPEGWAEADAWERGYIVTSIASQLAGRGYRTLLPEGALLARYEAIYEARYAHRDDPDGHDCDRAAGDLVDDLIDEHGAVLLPLLDANSDNPLEASIARLRAEREPRS